MLFYLTLSYLSLSPSPSNSPPVLVIRCFTLSYRCLVVVLCCLILDIRCLILRCLILRCLTLP